MQYASNGEATFQRCWGTFAQGNVPCCIFTIQILDNELQYIGWE